MSERTYIFLIGLVTIVGLYFESSYVIFGLSGLLVFEGLTDIRVTEIVHRIVHKPELVDMHVPSIKNRFSLSAVRAWHIMIGVTLGASYYFGFIKGMDYLWYLCWVLGVVALSAGVTSLCPLYAVLVWMGFKHPVSKQ